ncbi:MAG: acylphosphatase [Planctomycetota bacterium]
MDGYGIERREVVFSGRVQRVGFRATTRKAFGDRGLSGWVRNEPDGTVTTQAQGPSDAIDQALETLRTAMAGNIVGERTRTLPADPSASEAFEII